MARALPEVGGGQVRASEHEVQRGPDFLDAPAAHRTARLARCHRTAQLRRDCGSDTGSRRRRVHLHRFLGVRRRRRRLRRHIARLIRLVHSIRQ